MPNLITEYLSVTVSMLDASKSKDADFCKQYVVKF